VRMEDDSSRSLVGLDLRYVLTDCLFEAGPLSVRELVAIVEGDGFVIEGRPSKAVSDALRWEVGRGRVVRLTRGVYGPGFVPRQTRSRIRLRVAELRMRPAAEAA
jgi:hypothetical protein